MVKLPMNHFKHSADTATRGGLDFTSPLFILGCDANFSHRARDQNDFGVASSRHQPTWTEFNETVIKGSLRGRVHRK
jgi:hypothetical protein